MINLTPNPYEVYIDTERLNVDSDEGEAMWIGALQVKAGTDHVVKKYETFVNVPCNAKASEYGKQKYNELKDRLVDAPTAQEVSGELLDFIRCPHREIYMPPTLVGFCIRMNGKDGEKKGDLPCLIKQFGWENDWIANANVYDVALEQAFKYWPKPKNGDMSRSLENTAKMIGITDICYDKNVGLHTPIYDAWLTLRVRKQIDHYLATNQALPLVTTKEEPQQGEPPLKIKVVIPKDTFRPKKEWTDIKGMTLLDPMSEEGIKLAEERAAEGSGYQNITCPFCGVKSAMHPTINFTAQGMDHHYYKCDECGKGFNMDGSKGWGDKRYLRFNVDALRRDSNPGK